MNKQDIKDYLKNPTTTALKGFSFRVNYVNLKSEIDLFVEGEEEFKRMISINHEQYSSKEKFFGLLIRLYQLTKDKEKINNLIPIDPQSNQEQILNLNFDSNNLSFINSSLIITKREFICEIDNLSEGPTFLIKIYSLNEQNLSEIKNELREVISSKGHILSQLEENLLLTDTKINKIYALNLLNHLMFDFESLETKYNFFGNTSTEIRSIIKSVFSNLNLSYLRNNESFFKGSIALISLFIENRLVSIYELKIGNYQNDKTLGGLIGSLKSPTNYLSDIELILNSFKDIRNNLIHFHRRTFDSKDSFLDVLCYLGQFLIWCEDNGYI